MMKSYEDFLKTLTPDVILQIKTDCASMTNMVENSSVTSKATYQDYEPFIQSFNIAVELLRLYHEWLKEEVL